MTIAAVSYGGIGLALPLILHWSIPWLIFANLAGTTIAGLSILMWIANGVQANYRRRLVEWTTDLHNLTAEEFEWLVGEVFRREGWNVGETGRQDAPDGNVDLRLSKSDQKAIAQCKRWESKLIGVDQIRGFGGTLMREGLPATAGFFVTLSSFTEAARSEANQLGLTLVNGADLYARVERVRTPEPCPVCSAPMRLGNSPRGWWFRCVAKGCSGKRDLGRDPARAVELLTL